MNFESRQPAAIAAIYGSLLWPEGWSPALREIQSIFRADHILLAVDGQPTLSGTAGVEPSEIARLSDCIPAFAQVVKAAAGNGRVSQWQEIYPDRSAYERSEPYQELIRPLGGYHGLLLVDDESRIGIAACRAPFRDDYDAPMRQEMNALYPHLRMAREIADRFGTVEENGRSLARLIARIPDAVVLTDAAGRVVMMNDAAHHAVASAGPPYGEGDFIAAQTREATFALRTAIAAADLDGTGNMGGRWLALPGPRGTPAQFARILAFAPGRFGLPDAGAARVAVFIKAATSPRSVDRTALFDLFHLTPREADVACLLLEGHAPREIAGALGVSMTTVRTYLTRIFHKTGTRTQAALVALVSRFQA